MLPRTRVRYNRTTLMTAGLLGVLAGLGLAKVWPFVSLPLIGLLCVFLVTGVRRRVLFALIFITLIGIGCGLWRGHVFEQKLEPYSELYRHKIVLRVLASEDAVYGSNSQLTFEANGIQVVKPFQANVPGRIKISGFGESMVYRGDTVEVEGKLMPVRGGRQGQVSYATLTIAERHKDTATNLRQHFAVGMQNALPEPVASFGLGLLIGQRSTLPEDVSKQLAAVGLTHLIAVSGYNLTIIIDAARRLMGKRSKYQSTVCALLLVAGFLLVTGFSASIVRAAIVSVLSIWAWYYGRAVKPVLLIALAAVMTAAWNPLYIWGDIGWYLSFLAFFGVIVIAPLITRRIYGERQPKFLQGVLIETTSAQLMTLPLILYIFQQASLVSIVSNVLVVPLVPLAMLGSVIAGLSGMLVPLIAGWFAWPASIILTYMLDLTAVLSRAPHVLAHYMISVWGLLTLYGVILFVVFVLWRKTRRKHGIITDIELIS